MSDAALRDAEQLVRTIADTALENEKYFSDLDAVVGDGDFGYSLARGFGKLVEDWDALEYDDVSGLLKKTAMVLSSRIGGTSGPIWGTAFLRAGTALKDSPEPSRRRTWSRRCARRSRASSSAATPTSATRPCSTP